MHELEPKKMTELIEHRDKEGVDALMTAVRHGHVKTVECLLKKGADIYTKDKLGYDIIAYAGEIPDPAKKEEMLRLLKQYLWPAQ
jgi:ankyrin repeat protein